MKTITYNPETHKLVPIEPTEEMLLAMRTENQCFYADDERKAYQDMLNAALAAEETTLASRPWVGLTDNEWQDISDKYGMIIYGSLKRQIEDKLREKNAPAASDIAEESECPECGGNGAGGAHEDDCSKAEEAPQQEHDLKDVRCECCGYLTHQREHMGCIRAAKQQPASNGVTNTHGEPVDGGWQLRMVYFQDGEPTMHKAVSDEPAAWKVAIQSLTGDIAYLLSWTERCAHEPGRLYSIPSIPLFESPQPTPMELRSGELVQAARQALEALNEVTGWQWAGPMRVMDEVQDAISALQNALMSVPDGKGTT